MSKNFWIGMLIGTAVGTVVGMMIAPWPGGEGRRRVSDAARSAGYKVSDAARSAKGKVVSMASSVQGMAKDRIPRIKQSM